MQFTPKTELQVSRLLEKGRYKFKVMETEEKKSKGGKDMGKLTLKVFSPCGKTVIVNDWIMTDYPDFEFKVRHFAYSVGFGGQYEAGNLPLKQTEGKEGYCDIGIEIDKNGVHPNKNKVLDYIVDAPKDSSFLPSKDSGLNDDVPF